MALTTYQWKTNTRNDGPLLNMSEGEKAIPFQRAVLYVNLISWGAPKAVDTPLDLRVKMYIGQDEA